MMPNGRYWVGCKALGLVRKLILIVNVNVSVYNTCTFKVLRTKDVRENICRNHASPHKFLVLLLPRSVYFALPVRMRTFLT